MELLMQANVNAAEVLIKWRIIGKAHRPLPAKSS